MDFQSAKSFGKLRLRAFQPYHQILCILCRRRCLCMKMGKEHTHTFLAHNFLNIQWIFNPQKVLESSDLELSNHTIQILCILKHVEDVEDRSNTHKGCNAMYVNEDVEDGKRTYTHILGS